MDSLYQELKQTRPFVSLEEEVYLSLRLTSQIIEEPWIRHLRTAEEISPSQYNILRILRGAGVEGRTMSEVADRMINRDPDVTRLADRLVKRGLVRRIRDEADRRVVRLFIAQDGLEMLSRLDEPVATYLKEALSGVGRERLEALKGHLREVREQFRTAQRTIGSE